MKKSINLLFLSLTILTFFFLFGCISGPLNPPNNACNLIPEQGQCQAAFPRYFFNQQTGSCEQFIWGGCGGVVPFETLESCIKACQVYTTAEKVA
ncbi:MAG: BPTI/Kunitz domain-containing protein [archaeon]|nr:BPTI/Kunitz domain-containing protein [archaeon]